MSQTPNPASDPPGDGPEVGLFVTCLVDLMRPSVGFAAVALLEGAGCRVFVPAAQTCCGQPAYNSGARRHAEEIARQVIAAFEDFDYVVAPSGSCAAMLSKHYPQLLAKDPAWARRAETLAGKTHELVGFLTTVLGVEKLETAWSQKVTYHDSCSGLRELGLREQPRRLLAGIEGLDYRELPDAEVCCGFGGTFCVKYPEISNEMVTRKARAVADSGAELLVAGDLGCLLNMAGKLQRDGSPVAVRHIAEVLAGQDDTPAIGVGREKP